MTQERIDLRFYETLGPKSLADILTGIEATIEDKTRLSEAVSRVSPLKNAKTGSLVFIENRKYLPELATSNALACFVKSAHADLVSEQNIIPIISKTPRAHFARALSKLFTTKRTETSPALNRFPNSPHIHPTAVIAADAEIERDVEIGAYSVIGTGVKIGAGTIIGSCVDISFSILGEGCLIKSGAVIGGSGFGVTSDENGVVHIPHLGRVIFEDRVAIGSQTCVDRGQMGDTLIGSDTKIDNLVQIAHNVRIGKGCVIAASTGISGSVTLGDFVQLAGGIGIADHIKIGNRVSVGGCSGVMHDIPDGETWLGIPAQPFRDEMRMISRLRKLGATPAKKG